MFRSSPTPDIQWPSTVPSSLQTPLNRPGAQGVGLGFVVSLSLLTLVRPWIHLSSLAHCFFPVLCLTILGKHLFNAVQKASVYTVKLLLHLHKWGNLWKYILKPGNRLWKVALLLRSKAHRLLQRVVLYASVRKEIWWRQVVVGFSGNCRKAEF